jgi:hypothetical protein
MFIFSALAKACFFYLPYGIPNDHVGWVCARSWGFHVQAGAYVGLPLLSTNGDYVYAIPPSPGPGISLEGSWEVNSNISIGYDFRKWNVALEHRFHKQTPDSFHMLAAAQLGNPEVFNHHDIGIIIGRNMLSNKARLHQIGLYRQ